MHAASGGAFDVTVAPLMDARGVRGAADMPASGSARRGRAALDDVGPDALASVDSSALALDAETSTLRFLRPDVALDLGAIGKGHALDLAARALRAAAGG